MSPIYKNFTNFDVFAITKELNVILANSTIANIYEVEDLLILKINTKQGKKNLIIKKDSRINLTEFDYPIPKYPSQYIMSLRKFLKNRRIRGVSQYNFDRIIIFELSNMDGGPWKFVIELFNKGNYLVLEDKNILKVAKSYKKFKDRSVLANREYIFPKSRGRDFLLIEKDEFIEVIKQDLDAEIVRNMARNINIAGLYSEEICYRAEIKKKILVKELNDEKLDVLFKTLKNLRNELMFGTIKAQIVLDDTGREIFVIPFDIQMFKDYVKKDFKSFNEAVDDFYSKIDSEMIITPQDNKINQQIKSQEKILKNQNEYLEELRKKKQKYYEQGDFIYANFNSLEKLFNVILTARKKGYNWDEINNKLQTAKEDKLEDTELFEKIIPSSKQLIIKKIDTVLYLDLKKSIGENANLIYSKGKKAEKKIRGTIPAIEQTKLNIEKLNLERESMEAKVEFLIKKPKKKWYEKYRWFYSSNGFSVIGGRDASSNEVLFKKHLDPNDLVFHTTFPGSPLTIVKNPNDKEIPAKTIQEVADFVASYSRAWKENWGVVDVFYVKPEQVSKSPPTGEFLPKGSFMVSGKKNFIKNAKTELALGLELVEISSDSEGKTEIYYPKILSGPVDAIKSQTSNFVIILPSKSGLTKGKMAKIIKDYFIKNSDREMKKWIKLLSLDEIILYLPTGTSLLKKK